MLKAIVYNLIMGELKLRGILQPDAVILQAEFRSKRPHSPTWTFQTA